MPNYVPLATHKNDPEDYERAKELRRESSIPEQILWSELRLASRNTGIRFRRQHPIQPYIVDFVCLKLRLIIELDGDSHADRQAHDLKRDNYLRNLGYEVMRFSNHELVNNRYGVVQTIMNRADELKALIYVPLP